MIGFLIWNLIRLIALSEGLLFLIDKFFSTEIESEKSRVLQICAF